MKTSKLLVAIGTTLSIATLVLSCQASSLLIDVQQKVAGAKTGGSVGIALWAKTDIAPDSTSSANFVSTAIDSAGNVLAAGYIGRNGATYDFGDAQTSGSNTAVGSNAVLVKYDNAGRALWATSVTGGRDLSRFNAVAVDGDGNVYAAGMINGKDLSYDFGHSVTAACSYTGSCFVVVKYDSSGTAQWARTLVNTPDYSSQALGIAVDLAGNVFIAGSIGTSIYNFGNGVSIDTSAMSVGNCNAFIAKYDTSGLAQWATPVSPVTTGVSAFNSVAFDASSNSLYAAGSIGNTGTVDFGGSSTSVTSPAAHCSAVLVKYDASSGSANSGKAQWARTVAVGPNASDFKSVATDPSGAVYAAGSITGNGSFTFGDKSVSGLNSSSPNAALVKYDSLGSAQWAVSATSGTASSKLYSVATDSSGFVYASGLFVGASSLSFGAASAAGKYSGDNALLLKYDSNGVAKFARSFWAAPGDSLYSAVAADGKGNLVAAGYNSGIGTYALQSNPSVSVTGFAATTNSLIVRYGQ